MSKRFILHSSADDAFVRRLRQALAEHGQDHWIDSRELRGGDPLWPEICQAIEDASAFAVDVSAQAQQSPWVGKDLAFAPELRKQRGISQFPVVPISLDGTQLGVMEHLLGAEKRPSTSCSPHWADAPPRMWPRPPRPPRRAAGRTAARTDRPEDPTARRRSPHHRAGPAC